MTSTELKTRIFNFISSFPNGISSSLISASLRNEVDAGLIHAHLKKMSDKGLIKRVRLEDGYHYYPVTNNL